MKNIISKIGYPLYTSFPCGKVLNGLTRRRQAEKDMFEGK